MNDDEQKKKVSQYEAMGGRPIVVNYVHEVSFHLGKPCAITKKAHYRSRWLASGLFRPRSL